jgi:transcription elongation factor greA
MSKVQKQQITLEEKRELEEKLDYLVKVKRPENIERLQIARSYGDLSENSEYDAAKDEQAHLDAEIKALTKLLNESEVIDLNKFKENQVSIGKTVKVKFLDTNEEETYYIVSNTTVDIFKNKISTESPFGRAINYKDTGSIVEVESPDGLYNVEILSVERTSK